MRERVIVVTAYDPAWAARYEAEAAQVEGALGEIAPALHHIGSTAVPGLPAKPVIDILVEVDDINRVDDYNETMIALGYEPMGEYGIPGRRYFRKLDGPNHTHHVHVFERGHPDVARHLDFRDYLRTHPAEAEAYGRLKQTLAEQFRRDSAAYSEGKSEFIQERERRATAWRAQHG